MARRSCSDRIANKYNRSYTQSMKTAVSIPDQVFDAAEQVSKRMGVSRSRLYTMAIERLVKRERSRDVQKALDAVYATLDSHLEPGLAAMQFASLAGEEEEW